MRLEGRRTDGACLISLGSGLGVIVKGTHASIAMPLSDLVTQFGPWGEPAKISALALSQQLERARTAPLHTFTLGDRSKYPGGVYPSELEKIGREGGAKKAALEAKLKGRVAEIDKQLGEISRAQAIAKAKAIGAPLSGEHSYVHRTGGMTTVDYEGIDPEDAVKTHESLVKQGYTKGESKDEFKARLERESKVGPDAKPLPKDWGTIGSQKVKG